MPNSDLIVSFVLFTLSETSVGLLTAEIRPSLTYRILWTASAHRPWIPKRFSIVVMGKSYRKDFDERFGRNDEHSGEERLRLSRCYSSQ